MSFANVYLVTEKLKTASEAEVTKAEAQLGTAFPAGYREFVTTLGKGEYCGVATVLPPGQIVADQQGPKPMLKEFCTLWEPGETKMGPEQVAQSVIFAQSIDGDMAVFTPGMPDAVYMLPRSENVIYQVGAALNDALAWFYEPEGKPRFRYFNSGTDQKHAPVPRNLNLTYDEFRDWLLGLGRHDHVEEIRRPNEASGGMTHALMVGGKVQIAQPDEEKHRMAFFQCFSGYVLCYTDLFGRLNLQIKHDPTKEDGTVAEIAAYLQSKTQATPAIEVDKRGKPLWQLFWKKKA